MTNAFRYPEIKGYISEKYKGNDPKLSMFKDENMISYNKWVKDNDVSFNIVFYIIFN